MGCEVIVATSDWRWVSFSAEFYARGVDDNLIEVLNLDGPTNPAQLESVLNLHLGRLHNVRALYYKGLLVFERSNSLEPFQVTLRSRVELPLEAVPWDV